MKKSNTLTELSSSFFHTKPTFFLFTRWGHTPYDDAVRANNTALANLLKNHEETSRQVVAYPKVIMAAGNGDLPGHSSDNE